MGMVVGVAVVEQPVREVAARGEAMARGEVVEREEAGLKQQGDRRLFPVGVSNYGVCMDMLCCYCVCLIAGNHGDKINQGRTRHSGIR
jgi:hypothetical protein